MGRRDAMKLRDPRILAHVLPRFNLWKLCGLGTYMQDGCSWLAE